MSIDDGRLELGSRVDQQQEETNTLMDPSCAPCAVCKRLMPVMRTGLIRVHGPLDNRCGGSRVPPGSLPSDSDCGNSQILPPLVSDAPPPPPPPPPHPVSSRRALSSQASGADDQEDTTCCTRTGSEEIGWDSGTGSC